MNLPIAWWAVTCPSTFYRTTKKQTMTLHTSCALCWTFQVCTSLRCSLFHCDLGKCREHQETFHSSPISCLHPSLFPQHPSGFLPIFPGEHTKLTHQPEVRVNAPVSGIQVASHQNKREAAWVVCGSEACRWALQSQTESFPFTCTLFDLWINKDFLFPEIPLF